MRPAEHGGTAQFALARIARAAWLSANVYEGVVGVPELLSRQPGRMGLLATGSPVRFYALVGPVAVGGSALEVLARWRQAEDKGQLAAAAGCLAASVAVTGYLVTFVNVPLITGTAPADDRVLLRWHRWNAARVALLAAGEVLLRTE